MVYTNKSRDRGRIERSERGQQNHRDSDREFKVKWQGGAGTRFPCCVRVYLFKLKLSFTNTLLSPTNFGANGHSSPQSCARHVCEWCTSEQQPSRYAEKRHQFCWKAKVFSRRRLCPTRAKTILTRTTPTAHASTLSPSPGTAPPILTSF